MTDHPHSALRPLEGRIWHAVMQAAETQARTIEIDAATMPVRGAFLAWLLAEGTAKAAPLLVQLTLLGASIEAPLDQGLAPYADAASCRLQTAQRRSPRCHGRRLRGAGRVCHEHQCRPALDRRRYGDPRDV